MSSNRRRQRLPTPSASALDTRHANPFPAYDREIRRLRAHLHGLDQRGWSARSHCRGWSAKDVVAHLATNEVYNQACLDDTLDRLPSASRGLTGWNARGVRVRRAMPPIEVLQEWEARQERVRRAWGALGLGARIETSVGPYPLRQQVWHLAREYAIHADDIEVAMTPRERQAQLRWRVAFGLLAAHEEGEPVDAQVERDRVRIRDRGQRYDLDFETFIAYLTNRPQQLKDPAGRRLLRQLGAGG